VDEPTEHVATANVAERPGSRGHCAGRCGHLESKAAVRPMLVVMPDVVAKDCFEMMTAENERPVEALFPYGPHPLFRDRVRAGRSDGRPDHLDTFGDEHLVEAGGELGVAISDQEPERPSVLGEISREVAGNLGDKEPGRMKYPADRACRDADPEPAKLTLNAGTSPAAVLPAESDDELDDLIAEWRTSRTSLGSPTFPLASRELPVPAQQGLGRDEEATPAPPWKKSAERSKARSVRGPVADAAMELPLEQADLVAKHHQLDVLVRSCPSAGSQHLKNAARDEIAETEAHGR
jgi:hypothetical protein